LANAIELATKFAPIVDLIYKQASVTEGMDTAVQPDFSNTPEIKYLHVETTGLGDYSRNAGYPKGDVNATWKSFLMTQDRGKEISIDRMDDEETLNLTFGTVVGNFVRENTVPEVDAYRFSRYAQTPGIGSEAGALTPANILEAIDEGVRAQDENEVPAEGRILYLNSNLKVALNQALNRSWGSDRTANTVLDGYNDMRIVYVPPRRFYGNINMLAGAGTSWGYTGVGPQLNFMLVQPNAVVQVVKLVQPKIFDPDVNQDKDAWKYQFRMYHDAFVYENKASGIYAHTGTI
jgi:hypothetical protein